LTFSTKSDILRSDLSSLFQGVVDRMPISNFFVRLLLKQARATKDYDEDTIDMFRYGMQAVFWEIEKLAYFFVIFWFLGYHTHFLVATLVIFTIRFFAGGVHVESVWLCFSLTLLSYIGTFFVLPNLIPFNGMSIFIIALFSIMMTFIATPVRSAKREKIEKKVYDKPKKWLATIFTLIWFIVVWMNQAHIFAPVVMWTIFLQNVQMFIGYWKKRRR